MKTVKDGKQFLTPPEYARRLGICEDKVLHWIQSGELQAINAAKKANGKRPRWRISLQEIKRFEAARTTAPPPPKRRRSRRQRDKQAGNWLDDVAE